MDFNEVVFKGKSVADIFEEVYKDKQEKQKQIKGLVTQLKELIQDSGDAIMMIPQIKELMDLDIKNNDTLLRMLGIVQKYHAAQARAQVETGGIMSDKDKELLFASLEDLGLSEE